MFRNKTSTAIQYSLWPQDGIITLKNYKLKQFSKSFSVVVSLAQSDPVISSLFLVWSRYFQPLLKSTYWNEMHGAVSRNVARHAVLVSPCSYLSNLVPEKVKSTGDIQLSVILQQTSLLNSGSTSVILIIINQKITDHYRHSKVPLLVQILSRTFRRDYGLPTMIVQSILKHTKMHWDPKSRS